MTQGGQRRRKPQKSLLEKLPIVGKIVNIAGITFAPSLEDEATVEIVGQPGSTKKQLYYLGLAAAFSLCKRVDLFVLGAYVQPPPGIVMIEYDAADHWVRVTVRYKTSMLQAAGAKLVPFAREPDFNELTIYGGPKCEVVGVPFDFTGKLPIANAGIPASSTDSPAPVLPFADKTILTTCAMVADPNPAVRGPGGALIPSPNPKPPGDNRSRGAVVTGGGKNPSTGSILQPGTFAADECCLTKSMSLVPLVFAALTDPGSYRDEVFAPPVGGPLGS